MMRKSGDCTRSLACPSSHCFTDFVSRLEVFASKYFTCTDLIVGWAAELLDQTAHIWLCSRASSQRENRQTGKTGPPTDSEKRQCVRSLECSRQRWPTGATCDVDLATAARRPSEPDCTQPALGAHTRSPCPQTGSRRCECRFCWDNATRVSSRQCPPLRPPLGTSQRHARQLQRAAGARCETGT